MDQINELYKQQVFEAINQFTNHYIIYTNAFLHLKRIRQTVDSETAGSLAKEVEEMRYYEAHAWLRVKTIGKAIKIQTQDIENKRECILATPPLPEKLDELAIAYQTIIATQFTESNFSSSQKIVGELTKSL